MKHYALSEPVNGLAGVVFRIWKQRFFHVWPRLRERGLIQDWRHEGYCIALEAASEGLKYGDKALPGFIYNAWHKFLVKYGFKRPKYAGFYISDIAIGQHTGFLEKLCDIAKTDIDEGEKSWEDIYRKTSDSAGKIQINKKTILGFKYNDRYYFTQRFIEKWKERILAEFSPRCVIQQINMGNKVINKRNKYMIIMDCPWFIVKYVKRKDGCIVFIDVFEKT